jgi:hypothetical protein
MSYLVWASLALLGGAGGVVSTGHANTEVAAIMAAVAISLYLASEPLRIEKPISQGLEK